MSGAKSPDEDLSRDELIKLVRMQAATIRRLEKQVEELFAKLKEKNPTERLDEAYSQNAEEQRKKTEKEKKGGRKNKQSNQRRKGRIATADKIKQAQRTEAIYPDGVKPDDCTLSHTRVAWRLENGRAILVAYEIYRYRNQFGRIEGVLGRSEFGIEIVLALGYQVYCLGLSIDKACKVLSFFQQLSLKKSQADRLLNQLSKAWESEFESLCTILANSAVVYCDETSWSINSVWAFLNEHVTVAFYGVHKDAQTLAAVIDKEVFKGTLVSDDAAVYQGFDEAQKCWAHLIRKAIKLTLTSPEDSRFRQLADGLLGIYRDAKRISSDGRMLAKTKQSKVAALDDRVLELCSNRWSDENRDCEGDEDDYRKLCNELMRLMLAEELFVFVYRDGVDGNNNASERELRDDALARRTGRTSKTPSGAKRRSIISSVLRSIGKQVNDFTLEQVISEVKQWMIRGKSCFKELASGARRQIEPGVLNRLILQADDPA
jgi:transposase